MEEQVEEHRIFLFICTLAEIVAGILVVSAADSFADQSLMFTIVGIVMIIMGIYSFFVTDRYTLWPELAWYNQGIVGITIIIGSIAGIFLFAVIRSFLSETNRRG